MSLFYSIKCLKEAQGFPVVSGPIFQRIRCNRWKIQGLNFTNSLGVTGITRNRQGVHLFASDYWKSLPTLIPGNTYMNASIQLRGKLQYIYAIGVNFKCTTLYLASNPTRCRTENCITYGSAGLEPQFSTMKMTYGSLRTTWVSKMQENWHSATDLCINDPTDNLWILCEQKNSCAFLMILRN